MLANEGRIGRLSKVYGLAGGGGGKKGIATAGTRNAANSQEAGSALSSPCPWKAQHYSKLCLNSLKPSDSSSTPMHETSIPPIQLRLRCSFLE